MNTLALFGSIATIMIMCLIVMFTLWSSLIPSLSVSVAGDKEKSSDGSVSFHRSEGLSMHVDKANGNVSKPSLA